MAFAVINTGGRQLRVEQGDLVRLDRYTGTMTKTKKVTFGDVLLVGDGDKVSIGTPTIAGAKVKATVLEDARDRKVLIFKKKRRKGYRRTNGHRQWYTLVRIDKIESKA
ncbi:MAG: 50S ribosomal protein L21 [Acidobacteriota bacterium]|nr:50S ribosomal protein L21 [Acidobacteriota bacterium]